MMKAVVMAPPASSGQAPRNGRAGASDAEATFASTLREREQTAARTAAPQRGQRVTEHRPEAQRTADKTPDTSVRETTAESPDTTAADEDIGHEGAEAVVESASTSEHGDTKSERDDTPEGDNPPVVDGASPVVITQPAPGQTSAADPVRDQPLAEPALTRANPALAEDSEPSSAPVITSAPEDESRVATATVMAAGRHQTLEAAAMGASGSQGEAPKSGASAASTPTRSDVASAPGGLWTIHDVSATGTTDAPTSDADQGRLKDDTGSTSTSAQAGKPVQPVVSNGTMTGATTGDMTAGHTTVGMTPGTTHTATASVSGGAEALLPATSGMDESADQLSVSRAVRGLRAAVLQHGGTVTLRLSPPEMGIVRIEMQMNEGVIRAQLVTQYTSARDLLSQRLGELRQALEGQGLVVERLSVQSMSTSASGAMSQPGQDGREGHDAQGGAEGRSRGQYAGGGGQRREGDGGSDDGRSVSSFEQAAAQARAKAVTSEVLA